MTAGPASLVPDVVDLVHRLRAAGAEVSHDRVHALVRALDVLGARDVAAVRAAGRATLCASPEDLARLDAVLDAWIDGRPLTVPRRRGVEVRFGDAVPREGDDHAAERDDTGDAAVANASARERLRTRDVALLTPDEQAELARLLAAARLPGALRRTRRHRPARRGSVDRRRTVRALLRAGGEPSRLRRHDRRRRPRRVVLLVDVSGSMAPYADLLLRHAHATVRGAPGSVEVFTLGTRLTRVTSALSDARPDRALQAAGGLVPDHGGGTRLGATLGALLAHGGYPHLVRAAVVVVLSDGWERADVAPLAAAVARLSRLAHRVVWANPRAGRPGFTPTAAGMAAVLPHVDDLVPAATLGDLEALARLVGGASERERQHA